MTDDDILKRGNAPVQTSWVGRMEPDYPTGVENVAYDRVTAKTPAGTVPNPRSAAETVARGVVNVANPQSSVAAGQKAEAPAKEKKSYLEMYKEMNPYKPPTEEDLEKERKKQKRQAIFAAIGDGISALSNLYFTTQYAPNAYDPSKGMAAGTKARFDRIKKEREDKWRDYVNGYFRAAQMDDAKGYKDALTQMKEKEQTRKDAESKISIALKQAELDYKEAKTDGQKYLNELYSLKGQALEAGMGATAELIQAKIDTEKAKQYKYMHAGSGGGSQAAKRYPVFDENGDVVDHVYTVEEAVSETERNGGIYPWKVKREHGKSGSGLSEEERVSEEEIRPVAGRQPRDGKKGNPPGGEAPNPTGGNNGKKKTNVDWK